MPEDQKPEAKYVAIKNWKKFQPDAKLRNKTARLPWIKDYCDREQDLEFRSLTAAQRGILEGLCRLAGRSSLRLIFNDPAYVSQALHLRPSDCRHLPHWLSSLVSLGFLIPTDDENFYEQLEQKSGREGEGGGVPPLSESGDQSGKPKANEGMKEGRKEDDESSLRSSSSSVGVEAQNLLRELDQKATESEKERAGHLVWEWANKTKQYSIARCPLNDPKCKPSRARRNAIRLIEKYPDIAEALRIDVVSLYS